MIQLYKQDTKHHYCVVIKVKSKKTEIVSSILQFKK